MFPLIEADTNPVFVFACTALLIEELSLSTSVNTLDRSMVVFEASSLTVWSAIALDTIGASSTALTVTTNTSSTVNKLDVPRIVIVALPFWSAW